MDCPSCGSANPDGKRFCGDCGAPLPVRCSVCGAENPPGKKFCGDCSAKLPLRGSPTPAEAASPISSAERRQLTVMFCDLVGSTALATRLDPEDLREVIGAYHRCVADTVRRFEGFVAKYMGDGVLVYFGYPQSHEDDAETAVHAALNLVTAVQAVKPRPDAELRVRVGIATGLVVVGDLIGAGAAQEQAVIGETPNLAARLQAIAEPGSVVIAASTRRLLGSLFEDRDLGAVEAKGFDAPVQAWQVVRVRPIESRFEAFHTAALAPLVGRDEELDLLLRRWDRAKGGEGQVVLLSAEPGVGKSRLAAALQEKLRSEPHTRLRYFCSPHQEDSALHPVISQLERAAAFERDDAPEVKNDKLEALLEGMTTDDVRLLAELLGLPTDRYPAVMLSPSARKERILQALVRELEHLSRRSPVLMIFEDAHWIDPTSLELLQVTVDRVQHLPILLLLTFRPEFQPPWVGQPHTTVLALGRLNRHDTAALVERVASNQGLPPEIVEEIVERTDGVPLFAEELTKAVLETGASERDRKAALSSISPAALTVPTTLHASLMTRLDRLGPTAKEIAQIGAAIGREFRYELIASVARRSEAQVQDGLNHLVGAGLMFQRGTAPQSLYTFKHALVQDAAYGTLLRDRRKELHARIAQVLEQHFLQVAVIQPELLAHHCAEGGLIERAIDYWFAAGERALRTSANVEAVEHLSRGLRLLLSSFPETPDRSRKELRFQTTLGPALATTRGWAAAEVAQAYHRADELARALGDGGELFKIVSGLWLFHIGRGESHRALELSDELFRLAEQQNDDDLRLQAHHSAWGSFTFLGDFAASRQHTEQGIALYNPAKHGSHALTYGGHDPGVCGWAQNGLDLWFLGYPDRAAEPVRRSVQLAEEIGHPPSVAHALNYGLLYHQLRRDEAAVSLWSDRLAKLAAEQCLALHEANAIFARGWVLMNQGQARQGVTQLRRALDSCTDLGMREFEPYLKAALAEALVAAGETATGLEVLQDAMLFAQESGVGFWNAELLRLKGESLARLSLDRGHEQVEACYREALAVARRQQARSLELRAATSLARLWRDQGRHQDARDLLAPVYGGFTEGFDTPDLKEAKTLLAELLGRATPHP